MSLTLFFSDGIALKHWEDAGILEREVALYRRLLPHVGDINFVTHGDSSDTRFEQHLGGIRVLPNRWGLSRRIYRRSAAALHVRSVARTTVWKTNQTSGAVAALPFKRLFRKPLIVRAGYPWSLNAFREYGRENYLAGEIFKQERRFFQAADVAVVTTAAIKDYLIESHQIESGKVSIIPNYVDTDKIAPPAHKSDDGRTVCFLGRLVELKNVAMLIEAVAKLDVRLLVIGSGQEKERLEALASEIGAEVTFVGSVDHGELPSYFDQSTVFALPSQWEGQPKALLEAMSAGLPVVGADSPGIRDIVRDGETGLLCEPSPEGIADAISQLLTDRERAAWMGKAARQFVVDNFSLDQVVDLELQLYHSLAT